MLTRGIIALLLCSNSARSSASVQDATVHGSAAGQPAECSLNADGTCENKDAKGADMEEEDKPPIIECGTYMAPSTLGETTNMGMYAGKAYKNKEVLNWPEIAIPLLFREWGDHRDGFSDGEIWDRYIWEGSVTELESYDETNREDARAVFVPGIGCTINSIMDMNNIESTHGSVYDTAGLHRSKDPGTTGFTPYHSSNTTAVVDIPAGAEIFASYGDYWITQIPGAQITLDETMDQAEFWLRNEYYPFILEKGDQLTEDAKQALWEFTVKDFPIYSKVFTVLPQVPWKQVEEALEAHKTPLFSVVKKFIRAQSVRSIEWLDANGHCADHLKPGKSTIEQAGRGAFASRDLPKGTVVGYSPLIHMGVHGRELYWIDVPEEEIFDEKLGKLKKSQKKRKMYDLILNYSFGHKNSSVLLTPYGSMINYINHASGDKANVRVRWPTRELIAHKPDWLEKKPENLRDTLEKIGLSFEYVALRDIKEGEEVFMDYGPEWEEAWNKYVESWKPVPGAETYKHSTELGEEFIRTERELKENPYPDNVLTMCVPSYTFDEDGKYYFLPELVESYDRVHCRVLKRNEEMETYMVEMTIREPKVEKIIVQDVPAKEGIFLYNKGFSQDWQLPNPFRHEIMIPDDILPDAWKNGPPYDPSEHAEEYEQKDDLEEEEEDEDEEDDDDEADDDEFED